MPATETVREGELGSAGYSPPGEPVGRWGGFNLGRETRLPPWTRRLALTLVVIAGLAIRVPPTTDYDFCSYYTAGLLAREGQAAAAFDREELNHRHAEYHGVERRKGPFLYSPIYLLPAAAFSRLPFRQAELLNHYLGLALLGATLFLLLARARSLALELGLAAAFLLSHPVMAQLVFQNWGALLVFLVALAWHLTRRGRALPAAVAWALAIHLKVFVLALLLAVALAGRRRTAAIAAGAIGAALLLVLLSLPWVGWGSYVGLGAHLEGASTAGVIPFYNKISLQASVARFFSEPREWVAPRGPVTHPAVRWLFWLSLPLYFGAAWRFRRDLDVGLALALTYLLLFLVQVWDHTELLLLLAIPVLARPWAGIVVVLFTASWFYGPLQQRLLAEVLAGERAPLALRSFLLFFPFLNLLTWAALQLPQRSAESSESAE